MNAPLTPARVQEILELMRSSDTDPVQFSDYFSEIVAHDAAMRQRVKDLELIVNDDVGIMKRFDDQLAAVTKERDRLELSNQYIASRLREQEARINEIASLKAQLQAVEADALRWNTFRRLNDGGSFDMRRFVFDEQGKNGHWVWIDRYDMNSIIDQQAALGEVGHE